jgi:hypothetical protein
MLQSFSSRVRNEYFLIFLYLIDKWALCLLFTIDVHIFVGIFICNFYWFWALMFFQVQMLIFILFLLILVCFIFFMGWLLNNDFNILIDHTWFLRNKIALTEFRLNSRHSQIFSCTSFRLLFYSSLLPSFFAWLFSFATGHFFIR